MTADEWARVKLVFDELLEARAGEGFRTTGPELQRLYETIGSLVKALQEQISSTQKLPTSTLPSGEFPVKISEIRTSADPLYSTARGALMAALC